MNRAACRNFFKGGRGKRRRPIHYLLNQLKPYSCNEDFAKGFEPKVKMILFKKCCNSGGMLSKFMQFKCIMDGGLGASPQSLGNFRNFLKKKHVNTIWITFRSFLNPLKRTKLLRLRIYLKVLNCPAISALFMCRSNSNHV